MKLLVLNDTYFGDSLQTEGVEILRVGLDSRNDLQVDPERDDLFEVVKQAGFTPGALLQVDSLNHRVFFKGLERFTIPSTFYAVDTPINDFWQRYYARQFDRVWVDQYAVWRSWALSGIDWARWLPLAADESLYHPPVNDAVRDIPLLFVGSVDARLRPKRAAILHRLQQVTEVTILDGGGKRSAPPAEVAEHYRRARIVLNELLFDGINLRTFEAMACGAVLLTEQARGEEMLFTDGYSLVTFNQSNLENVVKNLLDHSSRSEHIGRAGAELVMEKHTLKRRAKQVIRDLTKLAVRKARFTQEQQYEVLWGKVQAFLKWPELRAVAESSISILLSDSAGFDPHRRAMLNELVGRGRMFEVADSISAVSPAQMKLYRAISALASDNPGLAADQLEVPFKDVVPLHLEIGDRLAAIGFDLTPGFNRGAAPQIFWTAFEHYMRALALDPENRGIVDRLDRILVERKAVEFTPPLWQRYHMHNPRDHEAERYLIDRARQSYLLPSSRNVSREGTQLPLRSSARRSTAPFGTAPSLVGRET